MTIKKEIINKVDILEKDIKNFNRCINVQICPECGNHLNHHITDDENLPDEVFECSNISCKFSHTRAWA